MAKPLKIGANGIEEFGATDTIPKENAPVPVAITTGSISSTQNDYSPTGWADADTVRFDFGAQGMEITGFAAWTNGRQKTLLNTTEFFAVVPSEHTSSTAANRVAGTMDHFFEPYGAIVIEYDNTTDRVRVVSNTANLADLARSRGLFYQVCPGATLGADWGLVGFGISSGNNSANPATSTLPATWGINTSTSSAGISSLFVPKTITLPLAWGIPAYRVSIAWVYVSALSDGTDTYTLQSGFSASHTGVTATVNNSIIFRYTHSANSGKWLCVSRNNSGTETTVDTGVTVAVNTLYCLAVCVNVGTTEARFYVNGALSGVITSNLPLSSVGFGQRTLIAKSAGTTSREAFVAYKTFFAVL